MPHFVLQVCTADIGLCRHCGGKSPPLLRDRLRLAGDTSMKIRVQRFSCRKLCCLNLNWSPRPTEPGCGAPRGTVVV